MEAENQTFQEQLEKHVDSRLRNRFFLYCIISIVLVGIVVFRIFKDGINPPIPIISFIIGIFIGIVITRIFHISWDDNVQKVISRLDVYGIAILLFYIFFELFRQKVIGYFIHGPVVVVAGFAVLAGIMIGRVLGMRRKIKAVIEENL